MALTSPVVSAHPTDLAYTTVPQKDEYVKSSNRNVHSFRLANILELGRLKIPESNT